MYSDAEIVRRYLERVWGAGETALLEELTADRVTVWTPVMPISGGLLAGRVASLPGPMLQQELDRAALAGVVSAWHDAFLSFGVSLEDLIADDGRVAARLAWQGTHLETRGIIAQQFEQSWSSFEFFQVEGGRIVTVWSSVAMYEWP